jgi:hypothetical protein
VTIHDRGLLNGSHENRLPPDNRGKHTPRTLLAIDERDRYLIEAARHFPGLSHRATARLLRSRLSIYEQSAWRRDRSEALCPPRHAGKLTTVLWMLLKVRDHVPSEMMIRRALAFGDPRDVLRFHI